MTLAQNILKNQLRIEQSMMSPFTTRPVIEPKINEKVREKFLTSNPFYRLSETNILNDLQLTKILSELNIQLPTGTSPSSVEGQQYIQNELGVISSKIGRPVKTITDLVQIYESKDDKIIKSLNQIANYTSDIRDATEGTLEHLIFEEEARAIERMEKELAEEESKSVPIAPIPTRVADKSRKQLSQMTNDELRDHAGKLGIVRGLSGKRKNILVEMILKQQKSNKLDDMLAIAE